VVLSLDDLYHGHTQLIRTRESDPANKLLGTRGQAGTHDEALAQEFFDSLNAGGELTIPAFDKSRFNGEGDRVSKEQWEIIPSDRHVDVVIFEGWSVGFQWLEDEELEAQWTAAQEVEIEGDDNEAKGFSIHTLRNDPLQHIQVINNNLRRYNETFMSPTRFNYLVHLDTYDLVNVYRWRMGQEHMSRRVKGTGMTDEEAVRSVQGYMPAYELYRGRLQTEAFVPRNGETDTQLRVVLDSDRKIVGIEVL
jgi:D-glycerate 3-kinase